MKPRYRPGKPATVGRSLRSAFAKAKPAVIALKKVAKKTSKKEGRGGKKKNIDFVEAPKRKMLGAEYEVFSHEGVRRLPKRRGTIS